jgi:RluA family pseudouridine synthase
VLYRDELVLAVDKPAGWLAVPGRGEGEVLSERVKELAPEALPVHRLDRGTTGVVLFALGAGAHRALNAAFESRRAEKAYLALACGVLEGNLLCELPLHAARRGSMRPAHPGEEGAQAAITELRPLEQFAGYTWLEARPRTGRTHQIRVHLAALQLPLAVDERYGQGGPLRAGALDPAAPDPARPGRTRTPLHAAAIRVPHPRGRGWLAVEAPLPADLLACLELLRAARRAGVR